MAYTADEVDQMIAKTKAELLTYIEQVIGMQKRGQSEPKNPQLLIKETSVEEENIS